MWLDGSAVEVEVEVEAEARSATTFPPMWRRPWPPTHGPASSSTDWPSSVVEDTCAGSRPRSEIRRSGYNGSPRPSTYSPPVSRTIADGSRRSPTPIADASERDSTTLSRADHGG